MFNWRLYYHVVWGTKNGLALIHPAWEKDLYGYIRKRAFTLDCIPHAIGGMPDHLHVVISIPPNLSVTSLIVQLKCASSHYINENYEAGSLMWQAESGVLSVSEKDLPSIVDYVNNQWEHHATNTLNRSLEGIGNR